MTIFQSLHHIYNYSQNNVIRASPIYDGLLSCSLSRVQTQLFVSAAAEGAGSEERTAGDRTRRRRLNKLSCADWLPHDRGFVSGLPRSKDERRSGDRLITGPEGSPHHADRIAGGWPDLSTE